MAITSVTQLVAEFERKAENIGLDVQCVSDGMFQATLAIIGEAPGSREVQARLPLVGGSGGLLWQKLKKYGITRNDVYISNVVKRTLMGEADEKLKINRTELDHWINLLKWELCQLPHLKYVLVLGNYALQALTGETGILKWRGSVLDVHLVAFDPDNRTERNVKCICTYNPAAVMREPKYELTFNFDLGKLNRVLQGTWKAHSIETHINPSVAEAIRWIDMMESSDVPVAFDIETGGGETACIGLANNGHEAMCIPFRKSDGSPFYSFEDERSLRVRIQRFVGNPRVRLIAQNGMFDKTWLWYKDRIVTGPHYLDTMLAHHTLYPTLPHNLGFITAQYTTHPYYKDEKDTWRLGGEIDNYWRYNGKDCAITWHAGMAMLRELKEAKLERFFFEHVMRLQHNLAMMTVGGVLIDTELKSKVFADARELVGKYYGDFQAAVAEATGDADHSVNPNSPRQLSDLYFNRLKLVGRGVSTDAENRQRMFKHPRTSEAARKVINAHNLYAAEHKFFSTYASVSIDDDNRMRCEYKQTGVQSAPGRLSSSAVLWGHYDIAEREWIQHGTNLQNQPERAHEMFIADPGYGFGYFDLSQAEARVVAYAANIAKWIDDFERARRDGSYDCHRALASDMFKVPYDEVPTLDRDDKGQVTLRFVAKRCRHGLNYRMAADRLATTTGLPLLVAEDAYTKYHRNTPELRRWWRSLEEEVVKEKCLYNYYGRRLKILERLTPEALESIVAFKPQSTIGDKVSRVIYLSQDDKRWPRRARIALNIHDALIAIAPIDDLMRCLEIMKKHAEEPLYINGRELIIPADLKIANSKTEVNRWSTLEKVKL